MRQVTVIGGGPAGSAAALGALAEGAGVTIFEPARTPRHKVCGEFLSPGFAEIAARLRVWSALETAGAAPIRRMILRLGGKELRHSLAEPAFGISRFTLDNALLQIALERGARVAPVRNSAPVPGAVMASGRARDARGPRAERLFGFKAHFRGPTDDAVELFFFRGCYAGVSPVENGITNVCGLAPLAVIELFGFDYDALIRSCDPLRRRIKPLTRQWNWLTTGPVIPGRHDATPTGHYPAGDALGFVDPFTGTGLTNALITGQLAGIAAVRGEPIEVHLGRCAKTTGRVFRAAGLLRHLLETGWAERLAAFAPSGLLFRLTRPAVT